MGRRWVGVLVVEGQETGDHRLIEPGALSWEALPLPLLWQKEQSVMGHEGAVVVGTIDSITRDGANVRGQGEFVESDEADEAMSLVDTGAARGISVDLDDFEAEFEWPDDEGEEPGLDELLMAEPLTRVTKARVRAATLVAIPAFIEAQIELLSAEGDVVETEAPAPPEPAEAASQGGITLADESYDSVLAALVAGAPPMAPPEEWFANPNLSAVTPLTITDDGRIYGHLAGWGVCHIGLGGCTTAPRSSTNYGYFHTGMLRTAQGTDVAVGQITMDTGHADLGKGATLAKAHYDHTGTAVADVSVGEDSHGIWVAGALRPDVTQLQLRRLRAADLSGDWRTVGTGLELVAALAVNVPGFPKLRARVASGYATALVATGLLVEPVTCTACPPHGAGISEADWDANANVERLPDPMPWATAMRVYAWVDGEAGEEVSKEACQLPHHEVAEDGTPGAANHAALDAAMTALDDVPEADRATVTEHLTQHYTDNDLEAPTTEEAVEAVVQGLVASIRDVRTRQAAYKLKREVDGLSLRR